MELPKIKKENLTQELREVVGDTDLEFESIVEPSDVVSIPSVSYTHLTLPTKA